MKKRDWLNLFILLIVLLAGYLLHKSRTYEHKSSWLQLDTYIEVTVVSKEKAWQPVMDSLSTLITSLENELSYHKTDSRLYQINKSVDSLFTISPELHEILEIGQKIYGESEGLFDLTIGPLTDIWDIDNGKIPTQNEILAARNKIGFSKISFTENKLHKPASFKLNLGGIAKGFIIDKLVEFLLARGAISGIINVGGDILLFGQEKPLRIGIQHPRKARNEVIQVIEMTNGAIVTSGDYERYFTKAGKRYHHIIDPLSGFPAARCLSVTVISDKAMIADAYSTALFLLRPEKAIALAEQIENLEAMVYYQEDDVIKHSNTRGFEAYLSKQM